MAVETNVSEGTQQAGRQELAFQAEVQQLLHILVHSLYTQKEIFLRELVSNAVDALDKMRFLQLTEKLQEDLPLEVRLECDETKGRLTLTDTGVGMTREELIENIGTIARSGTAQFMRNLSQDQKKSSGLIGQFGVGFYSVFMVAEKVRLITRSWKPGSRTVVWESDGKGSYTLSDHAETARGTRIEIDLLPDEREFCKPARIREIVREHSYYLSYPIKLAGDTINEVTALWTRSRSEVKKEEYDEFYRFITGQDEEPLSTLHFSLDTPLQLHALLYIPKHSHEMMGFARTEAKLALYSRRVLIQPESKDLLPEYLRFLRGLADSEDLPLNVSRESFQQNRILLNLRRQIVRKVFSHLEEMAEKNPDTYKLFYKEFGRNLKEGYQSDADQRERIVPLLRFLTTAGDADDWVSLPQYVARMQPDQKEIFYLSGSDRGTLLRSPHLEVFRKKGIEVLLLTDPLDDLMVSQVRNFEGKSLRSADQAGLDLKVESEDAEEPLAYRAKLGRLIDAMKKAIGEKVVDVRESKRLVDSPVALVNPQEGATAGIQKLMSLVDKDFVMSKRILEVNGKSPVIRNLAELENRDPGSVLVERSVAQLLDNAMLLEGLPVSPEQMVPRIQQLLEELAAARAEKAE